MIRREVIEKLPRCATALLMGCSSGKLSPQGDFEPTGMVAAFFAAGCPCVVANLWDVTDRDIDRVTEKLLEDCTVPGASLVAAVAASRDSCKFRGLTGSAPVVYGVPTRAAP